MTGSVRNVCLTLEADAIPLLFPLLREGFYVEGCIGCSIQEILCRDLGLTQEYVEERIQTVFLDGQSVDAVDQSVVKAGSTLALSAAMPGLAGATLRKGGRLKAFRREITRTAEKDKASNRRGLIQLKLFNLLVDELGPVLLEKGVLVRREALMRVLSPKYREICRDVKIDGRPVAKGNLSASLQTIENELVLFRAVKSTPSL